MSRARDRRRERVTAATYVEENKKNFNSNTLSVPENVELWKPEKEGQYRIEIIEYEVGENNPIASPGQTYFERTYFIHRDVGPDQIAVVCPRRAFNKPCPICEHATKLEKTDDHDTEMLKGLRPKKRQLFNIVDLNEKEKGIQIWDVSDHLFGKQLREAIALGDDEYNYYDFSNPDEGYTVLLKMSEESFGGNKFLKATAVSFRPRKSPIPDKILDAAVCLDEIVKEIPYDELYNLYHQTGEESPSNGKAQKGSNKPKTQEDDWGDDGKVEKEEPPKRETKQQQHKNTVKPDSELEDETRQQGSGEADDDDGWGGGDDWGGDDAPAKEQPAGEETESGGGDDWSDWGDD